MRARRAARRESLVPEDWQDQVLGLPDDGTGRAFSFNRLRSIVTDGALFLELWEREAKRLNWSSLNLFGVHPVAPATRFDVVGLVPILNGATVRLLTPGSAIIAAPTGSALTYTKAPQSDAVLLWEWSP